MTTKKRRSLADIVKGRPVESEADEQASAITTRAQRIAASSFERGKARAELRHRGTVEQRNARAALAEAARFGAGQEGDE